MPARRRILSLIGIVVVPAAAYRVPFVSPYAAVIVGAALALFFVWIEPASPWRELGLTRPRSLARMFAVGIGAGLTLLLISRLLLTPLFEHVTGIRRDLSAFDSLRGNTRAILTLLPAVWLSAGLCEEIVYRAYLITRVGAFVGRFAALTFAALVFALAHWPQGPSGMLLTGALAILFGLLFLQQRQNLWANVVAHITGDTASLILIGVSADRWLDHLARRLWGLP